MAKPWGEHSPAWRAKHAANGETPGRWNAWNGLSPAARKATSQADYARGRSVPEQRRDKMEQAALEKMRSLSQTPHAKVMKLRANIRKMTAEDLRWTIDATQAQIRRRAGRGPIPRYGALNPWWYTL